jgi:hypothetical protein
VHRHESDFQCRAYFQIVARNRVDTPATLAERASGRTFLCLQVRYTWLPQVRACISALVLSPSLPPTGRRGGRGTANQVSCKVRALTSELVSHCVGSSQAIAGP